MKPDHAKKIQDLKIALEYANVSLGLPSFTLSVTETEWQMHFGTIHHRVVAALDALNDARQAEPYSEPIQKLRDAAQRKVTTLEAWHHLRQAMTDPVRRTSHLGQAALCV